MGPSGFTLKARVTDRAVVARVRLVEQGEALGVLLPVEGAAVDQQTADGGAVPADVLGGRVDDDVGAVLEGLADHRGGRVVHDLVPNPGIHQRQKYPRVGEQLPLTGTDQDDHFVAGFQTLYNQQVIRTVLIDKITGIITSH